MDKRLKRRWWRLLLGVVTLLFAGIIYAWSVISTPFSDELMWGKSALSLNFTIMMCFFCLGGLLSGLVAKKISPTLRLIAAGLMVFGGFFLCVLVTEERIFPLYIGYGFLVGTGVGIVYNTVIAITNSWFPDKRGISSGALMMGFGFSTLTLGTLATQLFEDWGWKATYAVLGGTVSVIILLCAMCIKAPDADIIFPAPRASKKSGSAVAEDVTPTEMIKRFSFWRLFIFFILFAAVGSTAISGAKGQFAELGAVDAAATLAGVLTVCNGIGRIVSGAFFDMFGLRKTQYLTSGVVICATALTFVGYITEVTVIGVIGLMLCGFSYGFSPTVSAAFSTAFYGQKHFGINFPILNLILIPASFVPTLLLGFGLGYSTVFLVLTAFSLVGLAINISIRKA